MVPRKRQLLLAVVAVSSTGTALVACPNGTVPGCQGFCVSGPAFDAGVADGSSDDDSSTVGHFGNDAGPPIDAGIDDGPPGDGSAADVHVATDAHSD
ncbi:MAG TPA: hypothetical protein VF765_38050 [Polyangiaceae bacterium]